MITPRPHPPTLRALLAVAALVLLFGAAPAEASARSFFGVTAWSTPPAPEFQMMSRGGVGVYRFVLQWSDVEPVRGARNWDPYDLVVLRAAQAGVTPVPVLVGSPPFAASRRQYPPTRSRAGRAAFASFLRDVVARYGRNGTFWRAHPELPYRPITAWQVWNEPNFPAYWFGRPSARQYVSLLRLSAAAIRSRDRRAVIVLAGIPETKFRGSLSMSSFLRAIYRVRGSRRYFDVLAIHPYAAGHRGVLGAVQRARAIMRRAGDRRTPIWVTEVGWATGGRVTRNTRRFRTSRRTQAARLSRTFRALARVRRRYGVRLVVWFSWRDRAPEPGEPDWWALHTGLLDGAGRAKPAWTAYRRATGRR